MTKLPWIAVFPHELLTDPRSRALCDEWIAGQPCECWHCEQHWWDSEGLKILFVFRE